MYISHKNYEKHVEKLNKTAYYSQFWPALYVLNLIYASPNALQSDFNEVTILEPQRRLSSSTYTLGTMKRSAHFNGGYREGKGFLRSGKDDIARQKRSSLTQKADRLCNIKDHIFRSTILYHLPVELSANPQIVRIFD